MSKASAMLEGSPECAVVHGACTASAAKCSKCAYIVGMIQKVWECTGVHRSTARPGMCREVESVRNE